MSDRNAKPVKLRVWHGERHDDATVTDVMVWDYPANSGTVTASKWVERTMANGGFWNGRSFIPWRRINYIESTDESWGQP